MDRHAAKTASRPQVFLLQHGQLRDYKARADFSRGFFAVGGYDVISPAGFTTTEEAVAAFLKSKAKSR